MFEDYQATKKDLAAIEEGIKTVWQPQLNFVFKRKSLLKNIVIISYDSHSIYLWTKISTLDLARLPCNLSNFYAYKIPHKIKLKDEWQCGWQACSPPKPVDKLLRGKLQDSQFKTPKINGGLLTPFIKLQKKDNIKDIVLVRFFGQPINRTLMFLSKRDWKN